MKATLKTILGFFYSMVKRIGSGKTEAIENIYNFHRIPALYDTSGQPGEQELALLAAEGYEVVINLAPSTLLEGAVIREEQILKNLGMKYIHIPVDFTRPTDEDFDKFVSVIQDNNCEKLWVHCAANMRVSAFTYRYRRDVLHLNHNDIVNDLKVIWSPNKVWRSFLGLHSI